MKKPLSDRSMIILIAMYERCLRSKMWVQGHGRNEDYSEYLRGFADIDDDDHRQIRALVQRGLIQTEPNYGGSLAKFYTVTDHGIREVGKCIQSEDHLRLSKYLQY